MRKFLTLFLIILLLIISIPAVCDSYARITPEMPQRFTLYTVKAGDTLWGISEKHMPWLDNRIGVRWIRESNGLEDELDYVIQPGDRLNVPCDTGTMDEPYGQD